MPPTVVHLLSGLGFGGNESMCLQIVRHAPPEVANVVIYLDRARTEMAPLFQGVPGLRLRCLATRGRSRLRVIWAVAQELRALEPAAVLVYTFGVQHLLAGAGARLAGVPTICTRAGNPAPSSPSNRWKWQIVLWLSSLLAVPVHACSVAVQQSLRELGGSLPRGSGAIPNGCDVAEVARRARLARRLRGRDGRLVIGMVARLDPIKDQATLIRAFAEVAKQHPNAELWLVGDGVRAGSLRDLAVAQAVADRVVFFGPRADVP
jgi:glycosyltransferase involved in cell wall biosynthesis